MQLGHVQSVRQEPTPLIQVCFIWFVVIHVLGWDRGS